MRCKYIIPLLLCLCGMATMVTAQNGFSKLYNYDRSNDWGNHVFVQPDSTYFVIGQDFVNSRSGLMNMQISGDGSRYIARKEFLRLTDGKLYTGNTGRVKKTKQNRYLVPLVNVMPQANPNFGSYRLSGLALLDSIGDTIKTQWYTDSTKYVEFVNDCLVLPDGGYLLGGERGAAYINSNDRKYNGLLYRTDSMGNLLWEKTYTKIGNTGIASLDTTTDGNILIGAHTIQLIDVGQGEHFIKNRPWFILADITNGSIIKDTFYHAGYAGGVGTGGGNIFSDKNGGYFHWGQLDDMVEQPWYSYSNFSPYFAQLNQNFSVRKIKIFKPAIGGWHRYIWMVKQTSDSGYILTGSAAEMYPDGGTPGWAAKLDKYGTVLWENTYSLDFRTTGYLVDAAETPDGGFIFTGSHSVAGSPTGQDMWLVKVDSNGCVVAGCTPTGITNTKIGHEDKTTIYPNPATDILNVEMTSFPDEKEVKIELYDIAGRKVFQQLLTNNKTQIDIRHLQPGMYILKVSNSNNVEIHKVMKQ